MIDFKTRLKFLFWPERTLRELKRGCDLKMVPWKGTDEAFFSVIESNAKPYEVKVVSDTSESKQRVFLYYCQGDVVGVGVRWPNRTYYYTTQYSTKRREM